MLTLLVWMGCSVSIFKLNHSSPLKLFNIISDFVNALRHMDTSALIEVNFNDKSDLRPNKVLYASEVKPFSCLCVSFVFIKGFVWNVVYKNGSSRALTFVTKPDYKSFTPSTFSVRSVRC